MAAVIVPSTHDRWVPSARARQEPRPALRLVPPPRRVAPSRAVIYRRRRLAALVLIALTVLATVFVVAPAVRAGVGALGGRPLTPSGAPVATDMQPVAATTYLVHPGDTLWSIARRMQPSGDVRPLVDRLAAMRHGAPLHPGDRIIRP